MGERVERKKERKAWRHPLLNLHFLPDLIFKPALLSFSPFMFLLFLNLFKHPHTPPYVSYPPTLPPSTSVSWVLLYPVPVTVHSPLTNHVKGTLSLQDKTKLKHMAAVSPGVVSYSWESVYITLTSCLSKGSLSVSLLMCLHILSEGDVDSSPSLF